MHSRLVYLVSDFGIWNSNQNLGQDLARICEFSARTSFIDLLKQEPKSTDKLGVKVSLKIFTPSRVLQFGKKNIKIQEMFNVYYCG